MAGLLIRGVLPLGREVEVRFYALVDVLDRAFEGLCHRGYEELAATGTRGLFFLAVLVVFLFYLFK